MKNKLTLSIALAAALTLSFISNSFASSDFTGDNWRNYKMERPAINPNFNPNYSCLFDVYQEKCIPGSQQKCPKPQFGSNEDDTCFPMTLINGEWEWECPDGYHSIDDDETGQCYPNSEGCIYDDYILTTSSDSGDKIDRCAHLSDLCDQVEYMNQDHCVEYCNENPCTLPGTDCWSEGYNIGLEFSIDQQRVQECGKPYLDGWILGCQDANNTREDCELLFADM